MRFGYPSDGRDVTSDVTHITPDSESGTSLGLTLLLPLCIWISSSELGSDSIWDQSSDWCESIVLLPTMIPFRFQLMGHALAHVPRFACLGENKDAALLRPITLYPTPLREDLPPRTIFQRTILHRHGPVPSIYSPSTHKVYTETNIRVTATTASRRTYQLHNEASPHISKPASTWPS